jgi:2,4-dienoyl-CoA reductase (NADPH2)
LGKKIDAVMISSIKPDVLVIGTGGVNALPDIPGIENKKVVRNEDLHKMLKAALGFIGPKILARLTKIWMPVGKTVVIIGGAIQGCQLAHFLVKRGRKVTIVDSAKVLGDGLPYETPFRLFKWLREEGTAMYAGVTYKNINDKGLLIYTENGEEKLLQADSIILALPSMPDTNVGKALGDGISEIFLIGDCREFGLMHGAISDGSEIGHAI